MEKIEYKKTMSDDEMVDKAICIDCKYHRYMTFKHLCYKKVKVSKDWVEGKTVEIYDDDSSCYNVNTDGECSDWESLY
jgi:hypothetical protein